MSYSKNDFRFGDKLTQLALGLSMIVLTGCAANVNRPIDGNYRSIAEFDTGALFCVDLGKLTQSDGIAARRQSMEWVASWGTGWNQSEFEDIWREELSKIEEHVKAYGPQTVNDYCSRIEAQVAQFKIEEQRAHEKSVARAGATSQTTTISTTPRNATCNQIGTYTYCNSW